MVKDISERTYIRKEVRGGEGTRKRRE